MSNAEIIIVVPFLKKNNPNKILKSHPYIHVPNDYGGSFYIKRNNLEIDIKPFNAQIQEIQSTDQKTIAIDKELKAWKILQKPLSVDESGIFFEKYNKFPGTFSKYVFEGIGFEGRTKLLENRKKEKFIL